MERARKRFEKFLQPQENGCINWMGSKSHNGYGWFHYKGRTRKAHRIAWLLAGNTITADKMLRHTCIQNRACCNVEHLKVGTAQDNTNDMILDGTFRIIGFNIFN
jgi:hypothetical protein